MNKEKVSDGFSFGLGFWIAGLVLLITTAFLSGFFSALLD